MSGRAANRKCACGSGKKFKNCHGLGRQLDQAMPIRSVPPEVLAKLRQHEARERQRKAQQGLGKPIISVDVNGIRMVAVGNELRWSKSWKTFHDFLYDYIKHDFGKAWHDAENEKPPEENHPVRRWAIQMYDQLRKHADGSTATVKSAPMTGAGFSYLSLAYDLYSLRHAAVIKEQLLQRLRLKDQFEGARYETFVAACFLRAGFGLSFEDENDRESRHCEFVATAPRSGRRYSVEAKRRSGKKLRIGKRLVDALGKKADHERIVFIELNTPERVVVEKVPAFMRAAVRHGREAEKIVIDGQPLPPAHVIYTNIPHAHFLEEHGLATAAVYDTFRFPEDDYRFEQPFRSIRDAYKANQKHRDIFDLLRSMQSHGDIPITFDGQAPELAFAEQKAEERLVIGQKYSFTDGQGGVETAVLEDAAVAGDKAHGVYRFANGVRRIQVSPLSKEELAAYERHPDTFFGVVKEVPKNLEHPLELFEWLLKANSHTSIEDILKFFERASDIEELKLLPEPELREIHAERLTFGMMRHAARAKRVPRPSQAPEVKVGKP